MLGQVKVVLSLLSRCKIGFDGDGSRVRYRLPTDEMEGMRKFID
jgi:hypothetical protein